ATVAVVRRADGSLVFAFNDHSLDNKPYRAPNFGDGSNQNPIQDIGALSTVDPKHTEVLSSEPAEKISIGGNGKQVSVSMQVGGVWKRFLYVPKFKNKAVVFNPTKAIREFVQELFLNGCLTKPSEIILLKPTNQAGVHAEMRLVKYCGTTISE